MTITQLNSGTSTGTSFTTTLGSASNASNRLVLFVAGNTTVTTLSGWTLRTSQVNEMGHYVYDRAGDGTSSWGWSNSSGQITWVLLEIQAGSYDTATGSNNISASTTYTTPALTPTAGTRIVIASLGSTTGSSVVRTLSGWTNSFAEQADLCQASADYPMQGLAVLDNITANGSTSYSTTGTYSASNGRSALIASYATTSGGAPALPPSLIMQTRRPY